jgi:hypothetical protein
VWVLPITYCNVFPPTRKSSNFVSRGRSCRIYTVTDRSLSSARGNDFQLTPNGGSCWHPHSTTRSWTGKESDRFKSQGGSRPSRTSLRVPPLRSGTAGGSHFVRQVLVRCKCFRGEHQPSCRRPFSCGVRWEEITGERGSPEERNGSSGTRLECSEKSLESEVRPFLTLL